MSQVGEKLAIDGGTPVRGEMLPYARQQIDDDDVAAVAKVLRSDWLTTGPKVDEFESALAETVGTSRAVAVSSGTTALLAIMHALEIAPGDEVIVSAMTFMASANCAAWFGAKPVAADVQPGSLLLDPEGLEEKINSRTKAMLMIEPCRVSRPSWRNWYDPCTAKTMPMNVPVMAITGRLRTHT